jgi:hypothetical protein
VYVDGKHVKSASVGVLTMGRSASRRYCWLRAVELREPDRMARRFVKPVLCKEDRKESQPSVTLIAERTKC